MLVPLKVISAIDHQLIDPGSGPKMITEKNIPEGKDWSKSFLMDLQNSSSVPHYLLTSLKFRKVANVEAVEINLKNSAGYAIARAINQQLQQVYFALAGMNIFSLRHLKFLDFLEFVGLMAEGSKSFLTKKNSGIIQNGLAHAKLRLSKILVEESENEVLIRISDDLLLLIEITKERNQKFLAKIYEREFKLKESQTNPSDPIQPLPEIYINPGTAPEEDIGSVLAKLNLLYQKMGGSGLVFSSNGVSKLKVGVLDLED